MLIQLTRLVDYCLHSIESLYIDCFIEEYNGRYHGISVQFDRFMIVIITYINGVKHGKYYSYPFNTPLHIAKRGYFPSYPYLTYSSGYFVNNKYEGIFTARNANGKTSYHCYKKGKLLWRSIHSVYGVATSADICVSKRIVKKLSFHKNGRIESCKIYKRDRLISEVNYSEDGCLIKI